MPVRQPQSTARDAPSNRRGRAAPLSAPERRSAIIAATIPLLRECGVAVTTRRIAEAAQVAEGTIFSVFADKETLIAEAVEAALAPTDTVEEVRAIDPSLPLARRLGEAVEALQHHFAQAWRLLAAVGPPPGRQHKIPPPAVAFSHFGPALEALLAPEADVLRASPTEAARVLLALTLGCSHPAVVEEPAHHDDVVALFLHGIRKAPA